MRSLEGGNISTNLFRMDFLLWGAGDEDLKEYFLRYQRSANVEWTVVSNNRSRHSYADVVQQPRFFSFNPPICESCNNSVSDVHPQVHSRRADNAILTAPNNIALGRAGSQRFQNSRPARQARGELNSFCVRCLMSGHLRPKCVNKIRCKACKRWGHIAVKCRFQAAVNDPASVLANPNQPSLDTGHDFRSNNPRDPIARGTDATTSRNQLLVVNSVSPA